jgi:hypothetical protein
MAFNHRWREEAKNTMGEANSRRSLHGEETHIPRNFAHIMMIDTPTSNIEDNIVTHTTQGQHLDTS